MGIVILSNIPMPISVNGCYATKFVLGKVIRFRSKAYDDWIRDFKNWALVNHREVAEARQLLKDSVLDINCLFWFHRASILTKKGEVKRNDTSNRIKPLHDLIAEYLWLDDRMFWSGKFDKKITDRPNEYVEVIISKRMIS